MTKKPGDEIPQATLEVLARSIYREAAAYGFGLQDYVRFVNVFLDMAMQAHAAPGPGRQPAASAAPSDAASSAPEPLPDVATLPIRGRRVHLRAFDPALDRERLTRWLADPDGRYFLLSRTDHRHLGLDDLLSEPSNVLAIVTLPDQTPVGMMVFCNFDPEQHKAELRKLIGEPSYRGRGLAKEAARLWIAYGQAALSIRKIYLNTLETNIPNIRLNEELGFRIEGVLHNEVLIDGRYHDVLRMGLWREGEGTPTA